MTHAAAIRFHSTLLAVSFLSACGPTPELKIQADRTFIPAGGAAAHLNISAPVPLDPSGLTASISEGVHSARIARTYFDAGSWHVTVQSKVLPGKVEVKVTLPPFAPVTTLIAITPNDSPNLLRLDDPADDVSFRKWFTFLAEAQFFRPTGTLPPDISDCAGLIRYAYRETLRSHDGAWAKSSGLPLVPAIPQVRKYEYPFTPWGASLFRTGESSIAEFADAATLLRYNTHFVSRDIRQALPGDLLFFHDEDAAMPYHSMIYLGRSQIENSPETFVVYHTGRLNEARGEIRRPSVEELQHHPDPAWHLNPGNAHYLGVFRWNILS